MNHLPLVQPALGRGEHKLRAAAAFKTVHCLKPSKHTSPAWLRRKYCMSVTGINVVRAAKSAPYDVVAINMHFKKPAIINQPSALRAAAGSATWAEQEATEVVSSRASSVYYACCREGATGESVTV